jgi:hypothetical protein
MTSSIVASALNFYKKTLLVVVPCTTTLGFASGLSEIVCEDIKTSALSKFSTVVAYTTMGTLVGFTYPITFPSITFERFRC